MGAGVPGGRRESAVSQNPEDSGGRQQESSEQETFNLLASLGQHQLYVRFDEVFRNESKMQLCGPV